MSQLLTASESSTEAEQQKIYRDYGDQLVTFVVECYNSTLERLNTDKEFCGKFEKALGRDVSELEEYFKVPFLLGRVIKHLRGELPVMSQVDQIINIVRSLLHPGNHLLLRREGVRLLMFWLRDESAVLPEIVGLFASIVSLRLFAVDNPNIELDQPLFPLAHEDEPPIFLAAGSTTPREQALAMFTEILDFITFDEDADRQSTLFLYGLLREHYLVKLYPVVCRKAGITDKDIPMDGFIEFCPPQIQAVLMRYLAMWTIQAPELFNSRGHSSNSMPVATFILQEIILTSPPDLELVHEVISQSLQLPPSYKPIVKIALSVLRAWVFNAKERRPAFLTADGDDGAITFDKYLQNYMGFVGLVFRTRGIQGHVGEQVELYREGIYFLRGVAMKAFFTLSDDSWMTLLETILKLCETHLATSIAVISDATKAEEFTQLLIETLFGVWIRSETTVQSQWERLAKVLGKCTRWQSVVIEWSRTIIDLTDLMIRTVFSNLPVKDAEFIRKKQLRHGTYEGANLQGLLAMQNPLGRAMTIEQCSTQSKSPLQPAVPDRKTDNFLMWTESSWTLENVVFLWRNILRALGDVNAIQIPENHEIAIQCLLSVTEKLFALRETQPYLWRPLPPLYECALTFLDACDLPARAYERSRCLAYSAICRLFVRRHDMAFPDEFYTRFYLALVNGLSDKDDPVAAVILLNASHLFGRQLPGSTILIPAFLKSIAAMLNSVITMERSGMLVPMMRIAAHVAILPDVVPTLTIPRIEAPLPIMSAIPITCAGEMELAAIRLQTRDFLTLLDGQEWVRNDASVHAVLLNVTTVLLINELLSVAIPSETLIDGYLNVLLDHLLPKDSPVLSAIFDQFYALAQSLSLFSEKFTAERQTIVVQRIITAIRSAYADVDMKPADQDDLSAKLILILLEWLMVLPHDWLAKHHSLREQVFAVLEESLKRGTPMTKSQASIHNLDEEPSLAKEAAEFALVHLLHHLKNFSPVDGTASINSQVPEAAWHGDDRILYFALDDSAILAIQHLNQTKGPQVRLTIRNAVGRFTWDARTFFETFQHRDIPRDNWASIGTLGKLSFVDTNIVDATPRYCAIPTVLQPYKRRLKGLPIFDENLVDLEQTDMLCELLAYISEEHPECVNNERADVGLVKPDPVSPLRLEAVNQVAACCREQMIVEERTAKNYLGGDHVRHEKAQPTTRSGITSAIPYHYCRQFLASFGFFDPNGTTNGQLQVLTKTSGMARDLQGLDKLPSREVIKIGVLYVGPGQEDEASILRNTRENASSAYEEFLRALGWQVELRTHYGYTGGLEVGTTEGDIAIYYASSSVECIFHDSTIIIQDERDSKLISKKRHIGNDHVHIVWNEHYRDYRPLTIRTDYANVQIIITPLDGHLYRICVIRESSVGPFGPLFDGCIAPRSLLGPLVRSTAINAHRAVLASLGRTAIHPMSLRARDISLIVKRHAQSKWSMEQFLTYSMFANNPTVEEEIKREKDVGEVMEHVEALQIGG